ncbi:MAG: response regulator [bacterium]|nr:response regulator [bacterium]
MKVLIAEDHPGMSDYLENLFGIWEFEVALASNGKEAMKMLADDCKEIDLVVVEQFLPVIPGFRVLQLAKELRPEIPVFVLTSDWQEKNTAELKAAGFDWVFVKPKALAQDFRAAFRVTLPGLELAQ